MREVEPEDEVLGRAYDARLMRRMWAFTRPHVRLVLATCALFPLVSLLELAQPYLVKIATGTSSGATGPASAGSRRSSSCC